MPSDIMLGCLNFTLRDHEESLRDDRRRGRWGEHSGAGGLHSAPLGEEDHRQENQMENIYTAALLQEAIHSLMSINT